MPILPVLDLLQGKIVRGIAGRRQDYRPVVSKLAESAEPLPIARALRHHFGFTEFYLADLDAIQFAKPAMDIYAQLQAAGFKLWIDAGVQTCDDVVLKSLVVANVPGVVVGLETLKNLNELKRIVCRLGAERTVFSLDLRAGQPMGQLPDLDAWQIAELAIATGIHRMIVLDLARVGVGEGIGTEQLCVRLKQAYPALRLCAGGGVRGIDDVRRLMDLGIDHVLVASALHDGRITREDVFG